MRGRDRAREGVERGVGLEAFSAELGQFERIRGSLAAELRLAAADLDRSLSA